MKGKSGNPECRVGLGGLALVLHFALYNYKCFFSFSFSMPEMLKGSQESPVWEKRYSNLSEEGGK